MPQAPLIGKVATPDFNILGAILGGPRYMSQYLASKDTAQQAQQQMGLNADYAQQLIKRPDFQGAFKPGDQPYINMWASMQGGAPGVQALGSSLMERGIAQGFGKDMATFNETLQEKGAQFSADLQLQTAQKMATQEAQQRADLMRTAANPDTPQITRDAILSKLNIAVPAGTSGLVDPQGNISYKPNFGGPAYDTLVKNEQLKMDEIQPIQSMQNLTGQLLDQANNGTGSQGSWEATKTAMMFEFGKAVKSGSLDQGFVDEFNKLIPNRWDNVNIKGQTDIVEEKLKTTLRYLQGKEQQANQKWFVKPGDIPNASVVARPPPPSEAPFKTPPPPPPPQQLSPDAAQRPSTTLGEVIQGAGRTIWDSATRPAVPLRRGR